VYKIAIGNPKGTRPRYRRVDNIETDLKEVVHENAG
jgi:hypothetical protein